MNWNWIVSFNDGSRISAKSLLEKEEKKNPFQTVLSIVRDNPAKEITHIQLIVNGVRYNSPSTSGSSSFGGSTTLSEFFILFKKIALLKGNTGGYEFIGLSYKTGDYRHILWVHMKDNSTYSQVFNVTDPQTKAEQTHIALSKLIREAYETGGE